MRGLLVPVLLLWASTAAADGDRPDLSLTDLLYATDLARVTFNEAGDSYADLVMIHNIARAQAGENTGARRAWLRRHSPCVTGALPQAVADRRPGRCRWTRRLLLRQPRAPEGHPRPDLWPAQRPRWEAHWRAAFRLVAEVDHAIVCAEQPESWDGRVWAAQAIERGWRPVDCKGTRNIGYVRATDRGTEDWTLSAAPRGIPPRRTL